jgi:hypothetical protein
LINQLIENVMKLTTKIPRKACPAAPGRVPQTKQPKVVEKSSGPKRFRRLRWNELVSIGDFVTNEQRQFEPWVGPGGFRADMFVKPIYRREEAGSSRRKI